MKFIVILNLLFAATKAFASSAATDYKAMMLDGKVIATNGHYSYVIDPAAIQDTINKSGMAQIKIYGTEICLTVIHNGGITAQKSCSKNKAFFVLAPLKDMQSPSTNNDIDYRTFAMGYPTTSSIDYPSKFCTECAAPTVLNEKLDLILKAFVTAAKSDYQITINRKPGSASF
jgi:hypothetical protein